MRSGGSPSQPPEVILVPRRTNLVPLLTAATLIVLAGAAAGTLVAAPSSYPADPFGPVPQPSYDGLPQYGMVPGPPTVPQPAIRPSGWPGSTPNVEATSPAAAYPAATGSLPGMSIIPFQQPDSRSNGPAPAQSPAQSQGSWPFPGQSPQAMSPTATMPNVVVPGAYPSTAPQPGLAVPPAQWMPNAGPYANLAPPPGQAVPGAGTSLGPAFSPQPSTAASAVAPGKPSWESRGMTRCEGAQILAKVGSEVILVGDVLPGANARLAALKDKLSPEDMDVGRVHLMRQLLQAQIEVKLMYLDAIQMVQPEAIPNVERKVGELFEEKQVPKLMKDLQVASRDELENKLRTFGSSLERERRLFLEMLFAQDVQHEKVKVKEEEIPRDDMLQYYREHAKDFEVLAQARWEELMVQSSKYPSPAAAYDALAQMGNAVQSGTPFAEVAKARSDGLTASKGGVYGWTNQGSLASPILDQALFGLPVGALSQIIEDKVGPHIIRVVERKPAGRVPFADVEDTIRKKIHSERTRRELRAYLEELHKKVPVEISSDVMVGGAATNAGLGTGRPILFTPTAPERANPGGMNFLN
jgi:parvulin-like peptidyl-prolyl isomerase